jgi:hypothetical protein
MEEFYMGEVEIWRIDYTLKYIETLKRSFVAETQNQLQSQRTRKTGTSRHNSQFVRYRYQQGAGSSLCVFPSFCWGSRKQKSTVWETQNTQNEEKSARHLSTCALPTTPYRESRVYSRFLGPRSATRSWGLFFRLSVQGIFIIYSSLPPTKLDQLRTSLGMPSARGSFSFMH